MRILVVRQPAPFSDKIRRHGRTAALGKCRGTGQRHNQQKKRKNDKFTLKDVTHMTLLLLLKGWTDHSDWKLAA